MRIGHHDGAGLGVERLDLLDAVGLLHRRRQLVLADAVGGVVGERGDAGKPGLAAAGPGGAIGVVVGIGIAHQHAFGEHALQVLGGRGVDRVGDRDRRPRASRSRPSTRAGSSTACPWRARAPPRSRARRKVAPSPRGRGSARGAAPGTDGSGSRDCLPLVASVGPSFSPAGRALQRDGLIACRSTPI